MGRALAHDLHFKNVQCETQFDPGDADAVYGKGGPVNNELLMERDRVGASEPHLPVRSEGGASKEDDSELSGGFPVLLEKPRTRRQGSSLQ